MYLLAITGLLTSCAPTVEPPGDFGYNYIPIDTGRYYIYDVDSIIINYDATPHQNDTFHYQVKEFYPSTFIDGMGDTVVNVTRYYRTDTTQPWAITSGTNVWWLKRTTTRLEKTEENLTFVKMTYPIDVNYTWDGNAYNILGAQDYYYRPMDVSFNNGINTYDSTITVVQQDDTSQINFYRNTETYARNIGMVHKKIIQVPSAIINDCNNPGAVATSGWQYIPCPSFWYQIFILNRIRKGYIVEYKLKEYGFE